MAAELPTPTDEITGLPYPFVVNDISGAQWNYHHHFHPRRSAELYDDTRSGATSAPQIGELTLEEIAGLATRMCRGQMMPLPTHVRIHQQYSGPELPQTVDEKFVVVVKALSGVVSRQAIDPWRRSDKALITPNEEDFRRLSSRAILCSERAFYDRPASYRRRVFADFILRYTLSQSLDHIPPKLVNRFVNSEDPKELAQIGNLLLIHEVLEPPLAAVETTHNELKRHGYIRAGARDLRASVKKVIDSNQLPRYRGMLHEALLPKVA